MRYMIGLALCPAYGMYMDDYGGAGAVMAYL